MLVELSRYYDIDVIIEQEELSSSWIRKNCGVRNIKWFGSNATQYERVLYHFGNSSFHKHMFSLLSEIPGVVVMHDFFLSGIIAHMDLDKANSRGFVKSLYQSHGYAAIRDYFSAKNKADIIWKYPCNLDVLNNSVGVITHSNYSTKLASKWYSNSCKENWHIIPLLRTPAEGNDKSAARKKIKYKNDEFLVCSFGILSPAKLNHNLLESWLMSDLSKEENCHLIFVGEIGDKDYGRRLYEKIKKSGLDKRIHITGWLDEETYRAYLGSADIAVQLRSLTRGETSASALDCMNYALPTIVNANGAMAELNKNSVMLLRDKFDERELKKALEYLWRDDGMREYYSNNAREEILQNHAPDKCAKLYFKAIEECYNQAYPQISTLCQELAIINDPWAKQQEWECLASAISKNYTPPFTQKQLLVDVSELIQQDAGSGIQRVVRNILREWLLRPPADYRIEPVYATMENGYRYARKFSLEFMECPVSDLNDDPVEYRQGDIFLGLDLQPNIVPQHREEFQKMRCHGVQVKFVVYDLLCLLQPQHFFAGADLQFSKWLEVVAENDGAICISKAVKDELQEWLRENYSGRESHLPITWFHLGADMDEVDPDNTLGEDKLIINKPGVLRTCQAKTNFLMVGTMEPRKGHGQTLCAFEELWAQNIDVSLTIIGKAGWMVDDLAARIRTHKEYGQRLFWLSDADDPYLKQVYAQSDCLIAASHGEGFGLPLIEAAQYGLAIIARDIPVFREVADNNAFYFTGSTPGDLTAVLKQWLALYQENSHPKSNMIKWETWRQASEKLFLKITRHEN